MMLEVRLENFRPVFAAGGRKAPECYVRRHVLASSQCAAPADHLILNFPAAFSAAVLAYGLIEFHDVSISAREDVYALVKISQTAQI